MVCKSYILTPYDALVLSKLDEDKFKSLTEINANFNCHRSTVEKSIKRLLFLGLVVESTGQITRHSEWNGGNQTIRFKTYARNKQQIN
jgi:predicted transcriptional regulator